ncbi:MAG: malto-oligosyltrehalose trehalohydrolase [Caldimonas sp.]
MRHAHVAPFGAQVDLAADAQTCFRLWAPSQSVVSLRLGGEAPATLAMQRDRAGWHELSVAGAGPGTRYGFVTGGELLVPDPASRSNPDDVHGLSEVIDPRAYDWQCTTWRGRPWHEAVIYEMHIGTFTAEGSFEAAAEQLAALRDVGVTAIELLPVADFPGTRNWGYDGVLHFAPDASYGRPDDLKAFVDRAHGLGLMVLLDVVYNHFGPDGNYLHAYCPEFFNPRHQTPWGAAINFDGEQSEAVRDFYVHNALHWVEEYRFDGLRLDAIHAIADDTPRHIVHEIASALRDGPGRERHVHLVLENERNQASLLTPMAAIAGGGASAQWNDDLHHAAHVLLTRESDSYYADFAEAPAARFAQALAEGFVYQGQASAFRDGRLHGELSDGLPSTAFVSCLQNHDQIGNRAFGERLDRLAPAGQLDAAYACLLLSPHVPMLFMGEEFAASTPFLYFCDFEGELAEAVTNGRRKEFSRFSAFADAVSRARIPDPAAASTFEASKLDWSERSAGAHGRRLALIRQLLTVRRERLWPLLAGHVPRGIYSADDDVIAIDWPLADGSRWSMRANFGDGARPVDLPAGADEVFSTGVSAVEGGRAMLAAAAVWVGRVPR